MLLESSPLPWPLGTKCRNMAQDVLVAAVFHLGMSQNMVAPNFHFSTRNKTCGVPVLVSG